MRSLTLGEVVDLHRRVIEQSGGRPAFAIWVYSSQPWPSQPRHLLARISTPA